MSASDRDALRTGLARLPRANNHLPGDAVAIDDILLVPEHRNALDPERAVVVANRGMGKSFWTHALAAPNTRASLATHFPVLSSLEVEIGFNASERADTFAPTPALIANALQREADPSLIWKAVLVRIASDRLQQAPAKFTTFGEAHSWVARHPDRVDALVTALDDQLRRAGKRLLIVFDALDRLAEDTATNRGLLKALLQRALAAQSYRAIRFKLFIRTDQFADRSLFEFTDGSKLRNTRVDLRWSEANLYDLVFKRLAETQEARDAFLLLVHALEPTWKPGDALRGDRAKDVVDSLAGEFMGSPKRGRVFTWLPLHLADALGEISPRTFLTAWCEAAKHSPPAVHQPVDHHGLQEGVRRASEDRLSELREDYQWVDAALAPLSGHMVPMGPDEIGAIWRADGTAEKLRGRMSMLQSAVGDPDEDIILWSLETIGVLEVRRNGKVNVPDIFRVEARIKRKGGVKVPSKTRPFSRPSH